MENTPTFVIADNQDLTRKGLMFYVKELYESSKLIETSNKQSLFEWIGHCENCVAVIDYSMFNIQDVNEMRILLQRFPETYWLLLSNEYNVEFVRQLCNFNTVGFLQKTCGSDEVRYALRCAVGRRLFLCHEISLELLSPSDPKVPESTLTATETEILKLIAQGKSVKEIAGIRFSSYHTIVAHKKNIFRKLGVSTVFEATKYAIKAGLTDIADYCI
ncbi:MAG: response regulator transcription factor [Paludibacteraceae bacterium]|nr:response regulator transcription factor [Paludibacteraceae bacterium]